MLKLTRKQKLSSGNRLTGNSRLGNSPKPARAEEMIVKIKANRVYTAEL